MSWKHLVILFRTYFLLASETAARAWSAQRQSCFPMHMPDELQSLSHDLTRRGAFLGHQISSATLWTACLCQIFSMLWWFCQLRRLRVLTSSQAPQTFRRPHHHQLPAHNKLLNSRSNGAAPTASCSCCTWSLASLSRWQQSLRF